MDYYVIITIMINTFSVLITCSYALPCSCASSANDVVSNLSFEKNPILYKKFRPSKMGCGRWTMDFEELFPFSTNLARNSRANQKAKRPNILKAHRNALPSFSNTINRLMANYYSIPSLTHCASKNNLLQSFDSIRMLPSQCHI